MVKSLYKNNLVQRGTCMLNLAVVIFKCVGA